MNIISIPSPNHFAGRSGYTPKYVIVHGTAGGTSAQAIANYFAQPSSQASTNYIIGQDGQIVLSVDEGDAPYANGVVEQGHDPWWSSDINPNFITISIEHCKPSTDNSDQLTDAQKAASFALIKDICQRNGIPMRKADASGGITGHYSISPLSRARCPGPYPWDELWQYLQGGGSDVMPQLQLSDVQNWFAAGPGGSWQVKGKVDATGHPIILKEAFLAYYRSLGSSVATLAGLSLVGLPIENEREVIKGHLWEQKCERAILVCEAPYQPRKAVDNPPGTLDCYLKHLDTMYRDADSVAQLSAQVQTLNAQVTQMSTTLKVQGQQLKDATTALGSAQDRAYAKAVMAARDMLAKLPTYPDSGGGTTA